MKKQYIIPTSKVLTLSTEQIVCASRVEGVSGTGSFRTILSDDETDEYLLKSRSSGRGYTEDGLW